MYERDLLYMMSIRRYPVLKIMHMLNFLDTFSVGVIPIILAVNAVVH